MPFVDLFGGRLDLLLHGLGLAPHPLGLHVGPAGRKFRPEEGLGGEGVLRASVGLEQKSGQVFFQNCRLKRRGTEDMKPFFVELACHWPELDGFDQHFQATVNFSLASAVD